MCTLDVTEYIAKPEEDKGLWPPAVTHPGYHSDWAHLYDLAFNRIPGFRRRTAEIAEFLIEVLPTGSEGKVLDLGSGSGRFAIRMARNGWDVIAVDCSPGMRDVLARKVHGKFEKKIRIEGTYMEHYRLPEPIEPCGSAICLNGTFNYLQHPAHLSSAIGNLAKNLKPNALVVFDSVAEMAAARGLLVHNRHLIRHIHERETDRDAHSATYQVKESICGVSRFDRKPFAFQETWTFRYWTPEILGKLFERHGFKCLDNEASRTLCALYKDSGLVPALFQKLDDGEA